MSVRWSVGEEAAVVPVKCCGSKTTKCWKWWRIMCWQPWASWMDAVPCTVARNLGFSFSSLLPMLTLWGIFLCMFFQRTCILSTMKATYSVWCCLSVSGASVCPWIKWVQIQINSECSLWLLVLAYLGCVGQEAAICCFFVDVVPCFLLCCILRDQKPKQTTG